MFTGIIKSQAVLRDRKKFREGARHTFQLVGRGPRFELGESVAVDGTCVTISAFRGKRFSVDVIPETLKTTTLGGLKVGQRVNLEPALRVGDALGGHWVSGHVDGVGVIQKLERRGDNFRLQIQTQPDIIRRFVSKGSVAVDGISFTLQEIRNRHFVVGVTPYTFRATTLQRKRVGDSVNLEIDFFAKLVEHFLSPRRAVNLKVKELRRQGF